MKVLLNIFESILLSFLILLVVLCMTLLNKNYVKFILQQSNYYKEVVDSINNEITYEHNIEINRIKNDIINYIDNYYSDKLYSNKIETNNNEDLTEYYNNKIKFVGPFNNFRLKKDVIDICVIVLIVITGLLFMKTKKIHNINIIIALSGAIGLIYCFILHINNYSGILSRLINGAIYIYLVLNILLLLYPLFKKLYKRFIKK